jgi:hypothetical protein
MHVIKTNNNNKKKNWVNLGQDRRAMTYDTSSAMLLRTMGRVVDSGT